MGLYRSDHIIYGWQLDRNTINNIWADELLPMIEGHPGETFTITYDDNNTAFGYRVASQNEYGWNGKVIDFTETDELKQQVIDKYQQVVGDKPSTPPKLFIISTFS